MIVDDYLYMLTNTQNEKIANSDAASIPVTTNSDPTPLEFYH
jgi:hypothetical protein